MPYNKPKKLLFLLLAALFLFGSFSTAFAAPESPAEGSVGQEPTQTPAEWKSVEDVPIQTPADDAAPDEKKDGTETNIEPAQPTEPTPTPSPEPTAIPSASPVPNPSSSPTSSIEGTAQAQAIMGLQAGEDYAPNELLFFAKSESEAERIAEAYGGKLKSYSDGLAVMSFAETDTSINQALLASEQQADARSAGFVLPELFPNYVRTAYDVDTSAIAQELRQSTAANEAMAAPNDPKYTSQSFHKIIGSEHAWDAGTTGKGIVVAVLDSGIDPSQPDIAPNLIDYVNKNASAHKLTYDDGTGITEPYDNHGHGTHVAGIIAAAANNGIGGCGVAPNAKIMSVKVLEVNGLGGASGHDSDIIAGLRYAIDHGADIINMSLGGGNYSAAYENILKEAVSKGIIIIAAAGNDAENTKCYPAAYDNVIAVGALNNDDSRAWFSNYGDWLDISAPGVNILSTDSIHSYKQGTKTHPLFRTMDGTSQATPVVSGVAALMLSKSATLKGLSGKSRVTAVEKLLKDNAAAISATGMGAGRVDISKIFQAIKNYYVYEGTDYSPVFDYGYYRNRYPAMIPFFGDDTQAWFMHFIKCGLDEGRQASANFNVIIYMRNYPAMASDLSYSPLACAQHYCRYGQKEGRNASTLLPPSYVYEGTDYSPVFNYEYYRNRYPAMISSFGDDTQAWFMHFIKCGLDEGRQASANFNVIIYMRNYSAMASDLSYSPLACAQHYCRYGQTEGRNATTLI